MKQSNAWREKERDRLKQWRIKKKKAISLIKTTSSASIITNVNKINENNITPILDGLPINHVTEREKGLHNRRQDNNTTKSFVLIERNLNKFEENNLSQITEILLKEHGSETENGLVGKRKKNYSNDTSYSVNEICNKIEGNKSTKIADSLPTVHVTDKEKESNKRIQFRRRSKRIEKIKAQIHKGLVVTRKSKRIANRSKHVLRLPQRQFPSLHSFYVPKPFYNERVRQLIIIFLKTHIKSAHNYLYPILPFTNKGCMNYQSPQAIRLFFGRNTRRVEGKIKIHRIVYGPMSVLKSTGPHPTYDYKVHPFTHELETIINEITQTIEECIPVLKGKLCFNFLEIKMYLGEDMFCDEFGNPFLMDDNKHIRVDGNKKIGNHNDLRISDNGKQHIGDTANSEHPTVTITIGKERNLTFVRMTKDINQKSWKKCDTKYDTNHVLEGRSMFVLLPYDKTPILYRKTFHKTQHRALFKGSGISYALVFRSVFEESIFHVHTSNWLWKTDDKYRHHVEKCLRKKKKKYNKHHDAGIDLVHDNVQQFNNNLN